MCHRQANSTPGDNSNTGVSVQAEGWDWWLLTLPQCNLQGLVLGWTPGL